MEPVEIEFIGFCSKKNRKAPKPNGKGLFIEKKTREQIQRMELQVSGYVRDLHLDNPSVEWFVTYTDGGIDFDGIMTTVLDILQKYGVIVNDNLKHFGGRQVIHEAVRGEVDKVRVVLYPREDEVQPVSRYINPRRRRLPLVTRFLAPAPLGEAVTIDNGLEEVPADMLLEF